MKQVSKLSFLLFVFILVINTLGWSWIFINKRNIETISITTFQHTQLEIVRAVARSVSSYATREIKKRGDRAVLRIEQEIFKQFVKGCN